MTLKLRELQTHDEVLAEELQDPAFRAEWDRLTLARAVGRWVLHYRMRHSLSQRRLAAVLGIKQPQVARLEAAGHDPSLDTLRLLSDRLGAEFLVVVSPPEVQPRWGESRPPDATLFEDAELSTGTRITVAAR
jgi:transcriptional regulator with XRE-family HTH domain